MTAPITPADRTAALLALAYATQPVSARVIADVAQAIADAREAENKACEREVAIMVTEAGAGGKVSQTIALGEARLAIAARRSR